MQKVAESAEVLGTVLIGKGLCSGYSGGFLGLVEGAVVEELLEFDNFLCLADSLRCLTQPATEVLRFLFKMGGFLLLRHENISGQVGVLCSQLHTYMLGHEGNLVEGEAGRRRQRELSIIVIVSLPDEGEL
jgi:hypothetical protein